jgi:hypothetical protein
LGNLAGNEPAVKKDDGIAEIGDGSLAGAGIGADELDGRGQRVGHHQILQIDSRKISNINGEGDGIAHQHGTRGTGDGKGEAGLHGLRFRPQTGGHQRRRHEQKNPKTGKKFHTGKNPNSFSPFSLNISFEDATTQCKFAGVPVGFADLPPGAFS